MMRRTDNELRGRAASLAYVYQKADRILTSRPVVCRFEIRAGAPAWSIGNDVYFSNGLIEDTYTTEGMVAFTGVNYHELCHVMFTPTPDHPSVNWAIANKKKASFNILEDQRIESLMVAKYRSTAAYFTSMFVRHCLNPHNGGDVNKTYLLAYGRRYLPAKLRNALRGLFVAKYGEDMTKEAERLIDRFRKVVFRTSDVPQSKAFTEQTELIRKFSNLLDDIGDQDMPDDPYGHSDEARPDNAIPQDGTDTRDKEASQEDAAKEQQKADAKGDEAYEQFDGSEDDDDSEDENESGSGSDDSDDADGEDADEGQGQGQGDDESDDDGADGDASGDDDQDPDQDADDDQSGDGAGGADNDSEADDFAESEDDGRPKSKSKGKSKSDSNKGRPGDGASEGETNPEPQDVRDIAEDIDNAVHDSTQVKNDVRDWQERVRNNTGKVLYGTQQYFIETQPSPEYMGASRKFSKELQRMWADADPGWNRHQATGRLSMQRAMTGGDMDTIWDQWDEGKNDATDIEMVLLVDCSYSMEHQMEQASQASWAIKRAVEQVRGHVTVLGYSNEHTIHYQRGQRATVKYRRFSTISGTVPTSALEQAHIVFSKSKAHHKLLVVITDGVWGGGVVPNQLIDDMNKMGVATALAHLSHNPTGYGDMPVSKIPERVLHNCQVFAEVLDPMGIVALSKRMVKQAMRISKV